MKIKPEHYQHMAAALDAVKVHIVSAMPVYKEKGLSHMRLRWDAFNAAGLSSWACQHLYSYANDDHIDTALRHYFKTLGVSHA